VGLRDSPIAIRPVVPDDFPAWSVLWERYNNFYGRKGPDALPLEVTRTTWARFLDPDEPIHALVAERSGDVLGLAHFLFHRSTIQIQPDCYLRDLYTDEAVRRQGIGRALIHAVCERAQAAGSTRVYWQTHETNALAMRLYDQLAMKSGFIVYDRIL